MRLSLCLLLKLWSPQKGSGDVSQLFFFLSDDIHRILVSCGSWHHPHPPHWGNKQTVNHPGSSSILQRWLSTYCAHETLDRKVYRSLVKYLEKYLSECFPPWCWSHISPKDQVLVFCGCRDIKAAICWSLLIQMWRLEDGPGHKSEIKNNNNN